MIELLADQLVSLSTAYQFFSLNFVADSTQSVLSFDGTGTRSAVIVDSVSVTATMTPSARARSRRQLTVQRQIGSKAPQCPAEQTACVLPNGRSYDCVDLREAIEHCGTCYHDCDALPGVCFLPLPKFPRPELCPLYRSCELAVLRDDALLVSFASWAKSSLLMRSFSGL